LISVDDGSGFDQVNCGSLAKDQITNMRIKPLERALILSLSIVLFVLFLNATRFNWLVQSLDQAYFLETIDTTFETGHPTTMLMGSVIHALQDLIAAPVSQICGYQFENDAREYFNLYERHSFPILYGLAGLRTLFSAKVIFYLCALVAFPGLLLVVYFRSRNIGLPVMLSAILLLMVAFHPAWSYSAFGQFYLDKLFPILAIVYLFILQDWITLDRRRPVALVVIGILAASTSERSAIMLVAGTLGVYALFGLHRRWSRLDILPLILILILGIYAFTYMRYVQHNSDYSSFSAGIYKSFSAISKNTEAAKPIYKFLLINLLFLAPFALFAKRWALIALLAMLPNVIGSIGGAEKLGWTTHYHSAYFPFLIVAIVTGAVALWKTKSRVFIPLAMTLGISVTLFYAFLDPFPPTVSFPQEQVRQTGLVKMVEFYTVTGPAESIIIRARSLENMAAFVPAGSEVSTLEGYMPALYAQGVRWIHFYPLGLGKAEYLMVPYTQKDNVRRWEGFVSYQGPDVIEQANTCLQKRINDQYFVIHEFANSPVTGTAILKRR
jgi:hypothetical protein